MPARPPNYGECFGGGFIFAQEADISQELHFHQKGTSISWEGEEDDGEGERWSCEEDHNQ